MRINLKLKNGETIHGPITEFKLTDDSKLKLYDNSGVHTLRLNDVESFDVTDR